MIETTFTITDPHGLHARPCAALVKTVLDFPGCSFAMRTTSDPARVFEHNASVTLSLMLLIIAGIQSGTEVQVSIQAPQPEQETGLALNLGTLPFWQKTTS